MANLPLEQIVAESLQLSRQSRAYLAEKLLESLDFDEDFDISPEWRQEIARRVREINEGKAELIPADVVFARLRDRHRG